MPDAMNAIGFLILCFVCSFAGSLAGGLWAKRWRPNNVGPCGDVSVFATAGSGHMCKLNAGHTGAHRDGETIWGRFDGYVCDWCGCWNPTGQPCKYGPHDDDEAPEDATTRRIADGSRS